MGIPGPWPPLILQRLGSGIQGRSRGWSPCCPGRDEPPPPLAPCSAVTQPEQVAFLSSYCRSLMLTAIPSLDSRDILMGLANFLHPCSACLRVYRSSVLVPSSIPSPVICSRWGRAKWCGLQATPTVEPPRGSFTSTSCGQGWSLLEPDFGHGFHHGQPFSTVETMDLPSLGMLPLGSRQAQPCCAETENASLQRHFE